MTMVEKWSDQLNHFLLDHTQAEIKENRKENEEKLSVYWVNIS